MTKTKVVKAKVSSRKKKRKSKGILYPWEVWDVEDNGYHSPVGEYPTEAKAEEAMERGSHWIAPVIVYIDIPSFLY